MRELCYRVTKESSLSLHENDQLIKYLTECRRIKVAKEYKVRFKQILLWFQVRMFFFVGG